MITRFWRVVGMGMLVLAAAAAQEEPKLKLGAGAVHAENPRLDIQQLLNAQVDAWNRGNLDAFMAGYWRSTELTFFSNDTETHGWQDTLDRYKKRYQGEDRQMGQLEFRDLWIEMLSDEAALVRGRWHLKMPDGKQPEGMFTLVLRRFPQGWKIVHDHSSGKGD